MDSQALASWGVVAIGALGIAAAFYTSIKGIALAREMSEHELRAYVFLKDAMVEMKTSAELPEALREARKFVTGRVSYQYRNSGKTPAKVVEVAARAIWILPGASIDESAVGPFRRIGPIGPADEFDDELDIEDAPEPEFIQSMITMGNAEIHLIGRIKYSDEWSDERETSFHYYVGADAGWDEFMTAAITGNSYK